MYNALELSSVEALVAWMAEFESMHSLTADSSHMTPARGHGGRRTDGPPRCDSSG